MYICSTPHSPGIILKPLLIGRGINTTGRQGQMAANFHWASSRLLKSSGRRFFVVNYDPKNFFCWDVSIIQLYAGLRNGSVHSTISFALVAKHRTITRKWQLYGHILRFGVQQMNQLIDIYWWLVGGHVVKSVVPPFNAIVGVNCSVENTPDWNGGKHNFPFTGSGNRHEGDWWWCATWRSESALNCPWRPI